MVGSKKTLLWVFLTLLCLLLTPHGATADEEHHEDEEHDIDEHEHDEEHHFELSLGFDIATATVLTIRVEKEGGEEHDDHEDEHEDGHDHRRLSEEAVEYPFDHNRVLVSLFPSECSSSSLASLEPAAEALEEGGEGVFTEVSPGKVIKVEYQPQFQAVELLPSEVGVLSQFYFNITRPGCFMMLSEHMLELEGVRNSHGEVMVASIVEREAQEEGTSLWPYASEVWVSAIGATLVVCLISLVGVLLLVCGIIYDKGVLQEYRAEILSVSFGVHLALVMFDLLPQANMLYGRLDWQLGSVILGSVYAAFLVKVAVGSTHHSHGPKVEFVESEPVKSPVQNGSGAWNVIWGDLFHNLSDGVLIGTAFAVCSDTTGWLVTAGVILQEVPREMADFTVVYHDFRSVPLALGVNLLSSLSAISGTVLVLTIGQFDSRVLAFLLAVNIGALLFVCLGEISPILTTTKETHRRLIRVLLICCGFVFIGLLQLVPRAQCNAV